MKHVMSALILFLLVVTSKAAPLSDFWAWALETDNAARGLGYTDSQRVIEKGRMNTQIAIRLDGYWQRGWTPDQAAAYLLFTPESPPPCTSSESPNR